RRAGTGRRQPHGVLVAVMPALPQPRWSWWLALLCMGCLAPAAAGSPAAQAVHEIDTARSRIGFTLKTRWGQELEGRFPQWRGVIEQVTPQRRRVRLQLPTGEVEI